MRAIIAATIATAITASGCGGGSTVRTTPPEAEKSPVVQIQTEWKAPQDSSTQWTQAWSGAQSRSNELMMRTEPEWVEHVNRMRELLFADSEGEDEIIGRFRDIGITMPITGYGGERDGISYMEWEIREIPEGHAPRPQTIGHGAWAYYSAWGSAMQWWEDDGLTSTVRAVVDVFGEETAGALSSADQSTGTLIWRGVLTGNDLHTPELNPVVGDATVTLSTQTMSGTARFENLTVFNGQASERFRGGELEYAISTEENGFADANERLQGRFYGPSHEEVAGTLHDTREHTGLIAGFGAKQ